MDSFSEHHCWVLTHRFTLYWHNHHHRHRFSDHYFLLDVCEELLYSLPSKPWRTHHPLWHSCRAHCWKRQTPRNFQVIENTSVVVYERCSLFLQLGGVFLSLSLELIIIIKSGQIISSLTKKKAFYMEYLDWFLIPQCSLKWDDDLFPLLSSIYTLISYPL